MKTLLVAAVLGFCAPGASAQESQAVIWSWPGYSQAAARAMIARYGEPIRVEPEFMLWDDRGPWSKIVVYRDGTRNILGHKGQDVVEESIYYNPPDDKIPELLKFDKRLTVDKGTGELTSRAETEELNFLALNLADEIVTGRRTASQARDYYARAAELADSGKLLPEMNGLIFTLHVPGRTDAGQ